MMTENSKGLVMEVHQDTIIALTPHGEFVRVPRSREKTPAIGTEIEWNPAVLSLPAKRSGRYSRFFVYAAASLVFILLSLTLWSGWLMPGSGQVIAYVSIDINPSLELGLDSKGRVMEVTPLNQDAQKFITGLDIYKLPVEEAVQRITEKAVSEDYLSNIKENYILISVSGDIKTAAKTEELTQRAQAVLQRNELQGDVDLVETPMSVHDQARAMDVSPGKYIILLEGQQQGLDLSLEDLKGNGITKAVKAAGGIPGELVSQAQHDKEDLAQLDKDYRENLPQQEVGESGESQGPGANSQGKGKGKSGADTKGKGPERQETSDDTENENE